MKRPPCPVSSILGGASVVLGLALALGVVLLGQRLLPGLAGPHPRPLVELHGTATWARLPLFAYGFPAGLALVLVGAGLLSGARRGRLGWIAAGAAAGPALMIGVPRLFGAAPSPSYFGAGGVAILLLFLGVVGTWARLRRGLQEPARGGVDLQALGYLAFVLGAWNVCGSSGMPGWGLYPERVLAAGSQVFVVGQLRAAMAFFVLGWLCTLLGLRRAGR